MFNFGLSQTWNIVLSVIVWIAVVYIGVLIVNFVFIGFFKRTLKIHSKSMTVTLNAKFDNIKKLFDIMIKHDVETNPKLIEILNSIDVMDFKIPDSEACKIAREKLTFLREEAMNIARKQIKLEKNNEFVLAKNNVLEMDGVYRNIVACYNADVLGYNYWIKFLPNRWIFKIFRFKAKNLI